MAWNFTPSCYEFIVDAKKDYGKKIELLKVDELVGDLLIEYDKWIELDNLFKPYQKKLEPTRPRTIKPNAA